MDRGVIRATIFLLLGGAGCTIGSSGRGLLSPHKGEVQESAYRPEQPLTPRADGSLARSVHQSDAVPYRVEVRDVIVPPARKVMLSERGAVIAVVREGSARTTQGGESSDIEMGRVVALSEGETVEVDNSSSSPLVLRLYVITGQ